MTTSWSQCWSCDKRVGWTDHFCPSCLKLQPLVPEIDYFQFFGLGERLSLDLEALETRFHELSRKLHPDYFFGSGSEERQFSMQRSSFLNDAYRTLREAASRARYRLLLEGVDLEESKGKTPPDLLMEVFELNEELERIRALKKSQDPKPWEKLRQHLRERRNHLEGRFHQLERELEEIFLLWDRALDNGSLPENERRRRVQRMEEILSYRSFLLNLLDDLRNEV